MRRRLREDVLKPWQHRSWISIRDPDFRAKARRVQYVVSSDEKTSVQARCRRAPDVFLELVVHGVQGVVRYRMGW
ncbi:hypothetical protein [Streptomyces scabichelini]|uniref:hypothetical protein n=1 Tax=Streptomyces scabichelini TaxID=2711217 RepID=UPI001F49D1BF|nr:hypothetical protein [Streptomyces scabichelini]